MKEKITICEDYIKDCYLCWLDYGKEEMSLKDYLYGDFANDPTIGAMIGVNGFGDGPNYEEFCEMPDERQDEELKLRLGVFYEEAAKVVGMTKEQFESINPQL